MINKETKKMSTYEVEQIHGSMVNGQREQAVRQIEESEYSAEDVFRSYMDYLYDAYEDQTNRMTYFFDLTIAYLRRTK